MRTLCFDIGGTKCLAALVVNGDVLSEVRYETDRADGADAIRAWMGERVTERSGSFDVIGVGFGGPVNHATQTVVRSVHVPGWDNFPLAAWLREISGVPAVIDNDANVGALGEYAARSGERRDPFVYVTLSTGIGGAIISGGALLRGSHGMAGELGHVRIADVVDSERTCGCGNTGCLEREASGMWLANDHGMAAEVHLADETAFAQWVGSLASGLWQVIALIDPAVIVLGGGMAGQGNRLTSHLKRALTENNPGMGHPLPEIKTARHGARSVLLGCSELAKGAV